MKEGIKELVGMVQNSFGSGAIKHMGEDTSIIDSQFDRQPFNLYALDDACGGGLMKGGMTEVFGNEGDGKTTLALHLLGQAQKAGAQAYFLDAEHKLNIEYAKQLGVDVDELLITQPSYGEQGVDIMKAVLQSGLIDIAVVDSITALVPLAEINGEATDANIGAHARLMSKMCRVLTPIISQNKITFIAINQIRMKIGQMFGSPETTTGGKALKFYSGIRIKVTSSQVKKGESVDITKRNVNYTFVKNQWGMPYTKGSLLLNLGIGFDRGLDMIEHGLKQGVLQMASSHIKMDGKALGNGKANAGQALLDDEKLMARFNELLQETKKVKEVKKND